jgi:hypothetical protein
MIPKITNGGSSFKGAFRYYLHDKGKDTRERVAWTHTENLLTEDPDKAWKVMAYTAKEAERLKEASGQKMGGRKLTKPVFAYSLSWHPDEAPDQKHMLATAKRSLEVLGFTEHEIIIIAHRDEPQKHIHIVVNRVHPLTGLAGDTGNSKLKLSDFAREYEREHGKVYCPQREINHEKRAKGEKTRYCDPVVADAWQRSDNGKGFLAALKEKGYALAQGNKRIVVVDQYGQIHNPTRHLENVRAKQFQERLQDLDGAQLPDATKLSRDIQKENRRRYDESLRFDERVVRQRNEMQDRHIDQRARTTTRYEDRLLAQRELLSRYYRTDEQRNEIEELRDKTEKASWIKRLTGIAQKEKALLTQLEKSYENAQWRAQERLGQIAAEREKVMAQLKQYQETSEKRLLTRLEAQKPTGYINDNEREKMRQYLEEKRRPRNGPSLER